jgi:pSer/pThr/pTyr-binding forkhead associated (FHA) protein
MKTENLDSHVLVIHDQSEPRQFHLKAATYSLGRDKHNSIVLPDRGISRQHALLLRMPLAANAGYRYRIIDGNAAGKASLNGISINGVECTQHDLVPGDRILIGGSIQIEYQMLNVPSSGKYFDYLKIQDPTYQSIKAKALNPRATLINIEDFELNELISINQSVLTLDDLDDDVPPTELFNSRM